MTRWGYDDVSGVVIGGNENTVEWKIFYDNRPQGEKHYSTTEYQAEKEGRGIIESLKAEFAGICYEDPKLWEIRIYSEGKREAK